MDKKESAAAIFAREFPEHNKLEGRKDEKEAIEGFLSFLESEGMMIMRYRTEKEKEAVLAAIDERLEEDLRDIDSNVRNKGMAQNKAVSKRQEAKHRASMDKSDFRHHEDDPINVRFTEVVALFYDIDPEKFEREKRKMLDAIRCKDLVG